MKRKYNKKTKTNDYMSNIEFDKAGKPESKEGNVQYGLSIKSLKGLPHSSYSVTADPYDASLPVSRPYNIINKFNKKVGGHYGGLRNIDGGNVQQYANSVNSKFLNYFDFMRMKTSVNYRYRPMRLDHQITSDDLDDNLFVNSDYIGAGLVDEARQSIAEATSVLQSTTFTQMGIYNYAVITDLPLGHARVKQVSEVVEGSPEFYFAYYDLPDVIYATTTFYQLTIQELLNFINCHNSFRLKMGTMIRSSWNRETPTLNSLFGLFKKKSFLSLMDSLCMALPGEYVDKDWAVQMNTLNMMPSRRSDSMTDPVLELQTRHVHPSVFRIVILDDNDNIIGTVFDMEKDFTKPQSIKTEGNRVVTTYNTLFNAIDEAQDYLSAEHVMHWARNNTYIIAGSEADNAYFYYVKQRIDLINLCMTTFKTRFNDIREVLDVVSRTGLVTWSKGFRPSVCKDTDAELFDNQLIDDIYSMTFGGAQELHFNNHTKRWRTYSLWNMYTGIPEYDAMSGGCFISLSAKDFNVSEDSDKIYRYLPIMFYYDPTILGTENLGTTVVATNREGLRVYIKSSAVTLSENKIFTRLVPLASQSSLKMRVPNVYAIESGVELTPILKSVLYKTMTQVFGSACVDSDYSLDPDVIAVYELEIEDLTNDAIAYSRSTSPFRGAVSVKDDLGFRSFGQNKSTKTE